MSTPEQPVPARPDPDAPTPPDGPVPPPAVPGTGWGQTPRYGQYGQSPQYGQGGPVPPPGAPMPYGPVGGSPYVAAVKPGIVPLRPLTLGEIYDGAFSAVRHNPAAMLGLSVLVLLVATVLGVILGQLLVPWFAGILDPIVGLDGFDVLMADFGLSAGSLSQIYGSSTGLFLVMLLASPVVYGVLTVSISRSVLGEKASVRSVWGRVAPRLWVLIGWSLLQVVGMVASFALLAGLMVVTVLVADSSTGGGILLGLASVAATLFLLVWLMVRVLLVAPSLVLEGARLWPTVKRAWLLTRGSFWRTLGIYLLASIIVGFIAQIISIPLGFVSVAMEQAGASLIVATAVSSIVVGLIASAIQTIFLAGVTALLYIDLRMRREGLDVQLAASAAERQG